MVRRESGGTVCWPVASLAQPSQGRLSSLELYEKQIVAPHEPAYLVEMEFRYNNRHNPYLFRDTLLQLLDAQALPYQSLIQP